MDDYYRYSLGTTKTIKSKPIPDLDLEDADDKSTKFPVSKKIFKVFNNVEYKGYVTGYDHKRKLYHILYEDSDAEDFYHNKVRDLCVGTVKQHPKKKR